MNAESYSTDNLRTSAFQGAFRQWTNQGQREERILFVSVRFIRGSESDWNWRIRFVPPSRIHYCFKKDANLTKLDMVPFLRDAQDIGCTILPVEEVRGRRRWAV